VLDMWDPLDQDRSHVVKDAVGPLSCLHGFPGELIYVSGNHDMDIDEIRKTLDGKFYWGCKPGSTPNFEMYRGHYPATEKRRRAGEETEETVLPGIFVGDTKYSFIHGHQLDPEQIQYQIGEITQSRFDPVDAITDLANVSFIKEMRPQLLWAVATGWIVSLLLLFGLQNPVLKAVFTTILVVLSLLYLSLYSKDAEKVIQDRKFSGVEEGVIRLLFVNGYQAALILMFIVWLLFPALYVAVMSSAVFWIIFIILTFLFISCPVVRFIAGSMRKWYESIKKRGLSSETAVGKGFVRDRDTFDCDVVVFGHTHREDCTVLPGSERHPSRKGKPLLFVNTGCWVAENGETCSDRSHPFVFINEQGIAIMKWKDGKIEDCPV